MEQIRRDVVELTLLASEKVTRKTLDEDDQRRLIDETIDELDADTPGATYSQRLAVAQRIYAEALLDAATESVASPGARRVRGLRGRSRPRPTWATSSGTRSSTRGSARRSTPSPTPTRSATSCAWSRRRAAWRAPDDPRGFERLVAAEERILEVELTDRGELSDEEADAIIRQLEQAAGRKVDATRSVDPDSSAA